MCKLMLLVFLDKAENWSDRAVFLDFFKESEHTKTCSSSNNWPWSCVQRGHVVLIGREWYLMACLLVGSRNLCRMWCGRAVGGLLVDGSKVAVTIEEEP